MKILFTNTIFFQQKKGGVSRYFINLANEFYNYEHKRFFKLNYSSQNYKNLYF
jgi:hypothetical protein